MNPVLHAHMIDTTIGENHRSGGANPGPRQSRFERSLLECLVFLVVQSVPLGFDEIERALDRVVKGTDGYPPYNIERLATAKTVQPERLRITLAVAGFTRDQLDVTAEEKAARHQGPPAGRQDLGSTSIAASPRGCSSALSCWRTGCGCWVRIFEERGCASVDLARPEPERVVKTIAINEHE